MLLVLDEPLSFWGGVNAETGEIIQQDHPQRGALLRDRVMVMARAKGSSSSSSVLAELVRNGNAPAAIVMRAADLIVALGSIVASELYARNLPIVALSDANWLYLLKSDRDCFAEVISDGKQSTIIVSPV
ncbi:aconitase X swivel domain-containing protein [Herbaspirillum sp. RV1423]|uniref:aconitase X swivel domain-containing protein n=1 Tax=Herbaspirillum sp. RV1423 TaxID=1443993 RepID=UPI001E3A965E|nr:DUF126 domain-containing protein [Herbaspirillum sp. RV1423]